MSALPALRELLESRFPDATPLTHRTAEPVATGIPGLDQILPGGGLPRSRLTVWLPKGGATAILTAAAQKAVASGERAAWIDGLGSISGPYWKEGPLLVRPKSRKTALRGTEELLRCGGFALVVLSGIEPDATETVRLSRAAREGGGAFVALTPHAAMASLRLTSSILPRGSDWDASPFGEPAHVRRARILVRAHSLGWSAKTELVLPVSQHALRCALDAGIVDRRGVLPSTRKPAKRQCAQR
ncbi:hypothetical protein BH23GEM1_BH23GEM1_03940 [soil metagenome]